MHDRESKNPAQNCRVDLERQIGDNKTQVKR